MRIGLTEVDRNDNRSVGFFAGAGTAGAEVIIALALAVLFGPLFAFFEVLAIVKMWPDWDIRVAVTVFILTLIGALVLGSFVFVALIQKHRVTLKAMRNQAKLIHGTEQGAVYEHDDRVHGYSHTQQPLADMPFVEADDEPEEEIPTTFRELVAQGWVGGAEQDIVVGFTDDFDPIGIPLPTSLGISGVQGSGKTNTTLALTLATIAKYHGRCKLIVCDPHMDVAGNQALWAKLSPLAPFLLTLEDVRATVPSSDHDYHVMLNRHAEAANPSAGGADLLGWMEIVNTEMERRRHGKVGDVWIVVMDEFAAIMETDAAFPIAHMLATLNNEARKMDMFAYLSSREWLATKTGGDSSLRNSIASFVVHTTPESIAELIVPSDVARQAPRMTKGQVLFYSTGVTKIGRIVLVEEGDAENFVSMYGPRYPIHQISERKSNAAYATTLSKTAQESLFPQFPPERTDFPYEGESMDVPPLPQQPRLLPTGTLVGLPMDFTEEETRQIQAGVVLGLDVTNIAKQVYGAKSGPELAKAKIRVEKIMKWLVGRG